MPDINSLLQALFMNQGGNSSPSLSGISAQPSGQSQGVSGQQPPVQLSGIPQGGDGGSMGGAPGGGASLSGTGLTGGPQGMGLDQLQQLMELQGTPGPSTLQNLLGPIGQGGIGNGLGMQGGLGQQSLGFGSGGYSPFGGFQGSGDPSNAAPAGYQTAGGGGGGFSPGSLVGYGMSGLKLLGQALNPSGGAQGGQGGNPSQLGGQFPSGVGAPDQIPDVPASASLPPGAVQAATQLGEPGAVGSLPVTGGQLPPGAVAAATQYGEPGAVGSQLPGTDTPYATPYSSVPFAGGGSSLAGVTGSGGAGSLLGSLGGSDIPAGLGGLNIPPGMAASGAGPTGAMTNAPSQGGIAGGISDAGQALSLLGMLSGQLGGSPELSAGLKAGGTLAASAVPISNSIAAGAATPGLIAGPAWAGGVKAFQDLVGGGTGTAKYSPGDRWGAAAVDLGSMGLGSMLQNMVTPHLFGPSAEWGKFPGKVGQAYGKEAQDIGALERSLATAQTPQQAQQTIADYNAAIGGIPDAMGRSSMGQYGIRQIGDVPTMAVHGIQVPGTFGPEIPYSQAEIAAQTPYGAGWTQQFQQSPWGGQTSAGWAKGNEVRPNVPGWVPTVSHYGPGKFGTAYQNINTLLGQRFPDLMSTLGA